MQSHKAGNEQEQTESAVEDDVHNLGESFSFTRLIYDFKSEAESQAVAEKKLGPSTEPRKDCLVCALYLAGTGAVNRPQRCLCKVALQFG